MASQRPKSTVGTPPATVDTKFEMVLPRLVCAYERGQLVPFVGAGMSTPACRLWEPFVDQLEKEAGLQSAGNNPQPDSLVMRASKAIARLRALETAELANRVRAALFNENPVPPPQTKALCRLCWPMVMTTNYDDCLFRAFEKQHEGTRMTICGREPDDAQYVLNALYEPADPILWALQGYLGGPIAEEASDRSAWKKLEKEIVVGHEEYRKVAHAEPQFRRAFAEVFRSRSMLFVGSGLREPYFREMFSEILEIYGPCSQPHYAFVKKGEVDPEFMATRFQTFVVEYEDHPTVEQWLKDLASAVERSAFRQDSVSFAWRAAEIDDPRGPCSRLSVIQGLVGRNPPSRIGAQPSFRASRGRPSSRFAPERLVTSERFGLCGKLR